MKLPYAEQAYISKTKLTNYLLSETHLVGKLKAKFFRGFGFNETNVNLLEAGLRLIAKNEKVEKVIKSLYGKKYIIDGKITTPIGETIKIRTLWIIDSDQKRPRFVTAYPL